MKRGSCLSKNMMSAEERRLSKRSVEEVEDVSSRAKMSTEEGEDICRRRAGTSLRCTWSSKEHNTYMYFPNNKAKSVVIKMVKEGEKKICNSLLHDFEEKS